jgi:DNA repair exonuclease SbcCD ATPase subunit
MENLTVDVERIEQELQEIRSRFSKADIVLRELEEIQIEFENLAKTHKQLKDYVSEVKLFNKESNDIIKLIHQAQTNFEQRFEKLSEANKVETKQIQDELNSHRSLIEQSNDNLCKIQNELNSYRYLSDQLHQTLAEKQELFHQFQLNLTEIENYLSSTITTEKLNSEIIQLKSDVDGQYSKVNKEIRSHKKDMRIMGNAMIALLILWLCLGAFVLMK